MSADSWAQSGRRKRQKVLAKNAEAPKHRNRKDTKRWCRGVVGREHEWIFQEWRKFSRGGDPPMTERVCSACHKPDLVIGGWFSGAIVYDPVRGVHVHCRKYGPAF